MEPKDYFYKAYEQWELGHLSDAFKLYLDGAVLGDISCQHNLAVFYDVGWGTKKDPEQALFWYKTLCRRDPVNPPCANIASLYASLGNHRQAIFWWQKAINNYGDGEAALDMAKYLFRRSKCRYRKKLLTLISAAKDAQNMTDNGRRLANKLFSKF